MDSFELARVESETLGDFARVMKVAPGPRPRRSDGRHVQSARLNLDANNGKNGLGQLVLTLVKLLHELLERQAIRRMESGSLTDDDVERLGTTFKQLSEQMERLKAEFGVKDEDLNLDLGPLGKLL